MGYELLKVEYDGATVAEGFNGNNTDMTAIAALDTATSAFFSHYDPAMVEWFVKMVEERKKNNRSEKETKNW